MKTYERTAQEFLQTTSYGLLYRIIKICGDKMICVRYRRSKNMLYPCGERMTLYKNAHSFKTPEVGDFCFQSTDKIWSLMTMQERKKEDVPID